MWHCHCSRVEGLHRGIVIEVNEWIDEGTNVDATTRRVLRCSLANFPS